MRDPRDLREACTRCAGRTRPAQRCSKCERRALCELLPEDLADLVQSFCAVAMLQRAVRRRAVRYCHGPHWPQLRSLLLGRLAASDLDVLQNSAWVRREWRTEPLSWVYTAAHEPDELQRISEQLIRLPDISCR